MIKSLLPNGFIKYSLSKGKTLAQIRRYCSTTQHLSNPLMNSNESTKNVEENAIEQQKDKSNSEENKSVMHAGRLPPASPKIIILYKSPDYVIVNKPYDVRIDGEHKDTVEKLLQKEFPENKKFWWIHQLDYATSGVLCVGLNKKATAKAASLFQERKTEKTYLALLHGIVPLGGHWIEHPIADDPNSDFKMMPGTDDVPGRSAATKLQVLSYGKYNLQDVTKVALYPISGRRHQLRIHTLLFGHPIVGDATYTNDMISPRMMLHAWKLVLPFKSGEIRIETEDPFEDILDKI